MALFNDRKPIADGIIAVGNSLIKVETAFIDQGQKTVAGLDDALFDMAMLINGGSEGARHFAMKTALTINAIKEDYRAVGAYDNIDYIEKKVNQFTTYVKENPEDAIGRGLFILAEAALIKQVSGIATGGATTTGNLTLKVPSSFTPVISGSGTMALAGAGELSMAISVSTANVAAIAGVLQSVAAGFGGGGNDLKEVYNSIKDDPRYPEGFRDIQNGKKSFNIKNKQLLEQLRKVERGTWKKVYRNGYLPDGQKVSLHYFQSQSGKVFNFKIKNIWSEF